MAKILVVEDNHELTEMIKTLLEFEHHQVETIQDGQEAAYALRINSFDMVILDWELPGKNGIDICHEFRSAGGATPVLILTGRREIEDKESGLDAGADDYLTKPFHPRELSARVRALLRRPKQTTDNILKIVDLELDPTKRTVKRADQNIDLLPKEFALLEFFLRHKESVFSFEALLERVWQSDTEATTEAVRSTLKRLRRKIDSDPEKPPLFNTVHGVGVILREPS